jgi:15-cis-phytoene synthase
MQDAYRHCAELTRAFDKDRFLADLFAPAERRGGLHALHAFNVEIARVRELAREPMPGELRLQWWRDAITGIGLGAVGANPVAAALLDTMARWRLPKEPLLDLIDARGFDLYDDPVATVADLEAYARRTALIGLGVRLLADGDTAAADPGAIAYAITGLMRAFAQHAARRQLYVPLELLERHGVALEEVFAGRTSDALRAALAELRALARRHLETFEAALPTAPAAAMPALLPVTLARGYLDSMERDYDPFRTVVEVPQWRRQWVLWRAARRARRRWR